MRRPEGSRSRRRGSIACGALLAAALAVVGSGAPAPLRNAAGDAEAARTAGIPNDPLFPRQWHLKAIGIPRAWAVSRGAGATVAVLDTGVAYETRGRYRRAPDLAGTRFAAGWDFVEGDSHPDDEPPHSDHEHRTPHADQSHGTHIAGIIAQTTGNGIGTAGIAPKAAIMPVRVLDPDRHGTPARIARGLRYAVDHGADVINLSIAGPSDYRVVRDAVAYAARGGVTVVASAGNEGRGSLRFPAAYPEVIAVGALSEDRTLAYYSNYGKGLDLVAPVGNRDPVSGLGGVLQQTVKGEPSSFCYCFMGSTSAAAAEVSGVAALLVGSGRVRGRGELRSALLAGARDLGPRGADTRFGAGMLQAPGALAAASDPPGGAAKEGEDPSSGAVAPIAIGVALAVGGCLLLWRRSRRRRRS